MSRRVPSTHDGTSGPPKEMDASGCGWLRNPIHSAVATSSAPDSVPGVVGADQVPDELADGRVARIGVGLDTDCERVGMDVRHEVCGARELRRRLRATPPTRGRGVGHGDDAHRSTGLACVVAHRPHPRDVAADGVGDSRMLLEHLLPGLSCAARPGPGSCDHDRVDSTCVARRLPELLGRSREVRRRRARADPDALDAPRRQRVAQRRLPLRIVGDDQARSRTAHRRPGRRCGLVEHVGEPAVAGAVRRLRGLGRHERRRDDGVEYVGERRDVRRPCHFEQARRRDRRHLGTVGEDDVPGAPGERVAAEVRADRAELLG